MQSAVVFALGACASATVACTGAGRTDTAGRYVPVGAAQTIVAADARDLVEAWANAVGGRSALASIGAIHAKGTYEKGGLVGTIDLWETAKGERRETIAMGFLTYTRVFDGEHGWLVDRNREVRELAGWEIDEQLALAYWGSLAPLLVDRRGGSVTRAGDGLVLAAAGGKRPETVTFDRTTRLPVSRTRRDGEKQRTTTLSDYNLVSGVKMPFTVRESTDNPRDGVVVHWRSIDAMAPGSGPPVATFTRPPQEHADTVLTRDPTTVPIEVVFGGLVFVKVDINGVPMSFILDSGAESTVINASRIEKLGLSAVGSFATGAGGGDVALSYAQGVTTKVGDAAVTDQIVAVVPLDHLEEPLQRPLDGILGYDFLSRFVIELDYAKQSMRIFDRATYAHTGAGKPIPVTLEDGTPFLDAAIEIPGKGDVVGRYVLDTGCLCDVQLFTPFVDAHGLLTAFPDAKQAGFSSGAGGATHEVTATIPALKVGDQVIKSPRGDFSRDAKGANADPESAGLIGSLTWKRFVLVLDYKNQQVFLDPPRDPAK